MALGTVFLRGRIATRHILLRPAKSKEVGPNPNHHYTITTTWVVVIKVDIKPATTCK